MNLFSHPECPPHPTPESPLTHNYYYLQSLGFINLLILTYLRHQCIPMYLRDESKWLDGISTLMEQNDTYWGCSRPFLQD